MIYDTLRKTQCPISQKEKLRLSDESVFGENAKGSKFFSEFKGETLPWSCHESIGVSLSVLEKLISNRPDNSGLNILFYGPPGVGKTELARSIGKRFNLRLFEVGNFPGDEDDESTRRRFVRQKKIFVGLSEMLKTTTPFSFWMRSMVF